MSLGSALSLFPSWPDLFGPPMITVFDQVFMGPPHSASLQRGMTAFFTQRPIASLKNSTANAWARAAAVGL